MDEHTRHEKINTAKKFFGALASTAIVVSVYSQRQSFNSLLEVTKSYEARQTPHIKNVLGNSRPETFYVFGQDTVFQKIDDIPVQNYFRE